MGSEKLQRYIAERVQFGAADMQAVLDGFELKQWPRGSNILQAGRTCRYLYFIEEGCVRTYAESPEREITSWFYPENQFVSSWYSFLAQEPSFDYIEALEDSTVWQISYETLHRLYEEVPSFERFGRLLVEEQLAFIDYFSRGYLFLTAKQRYEQFLTYFPDAEVRVKLGHIASFLGITQETLSRIRSRK